MTLGIQKIGMKVIAKDRIKTIITASRFQGCGFRYTCLRQDCYAWWDIAFTSGESRGGVDIRLSIFYNAEHSSLRICLYPQFQCGQTG